MLTWEQHFLTLGYNLGSRHVDTAFVYPDAGVHLVALVQWRVPLGWPMADTMRPYHRSRLFEGNPGTSVTDRSTAPGFEVQALWNLVGGPHTAQLWPHV